MKSAAVGIILRRLLRRRKRFRRSESAWNVSSDETGRESATIVRIRLVNLGVDFQSLLASLSIISGVFRVCSCSLRIGSRSFVVDVDDARSLARILIRLDLALETLQFGGDARFGFFHLLHDFFPLSWRFSAAGRGRRVSLGMEWRRRRRPPER